VKIKDAAPGTLLLDADGDLFGAAPNEERLPDTCPVCNQEYWIQGGYAPKYTSAFSEEELE
jgi:hypothetical protein